MNKKKLMQFLDSNFPPYNQCTVIEDYTDKTVAILDYGKNDKLRVTVGLGDDGYNIYRLLQTDFI